MFGYHEELLAESKVVFSFSTWAPRNHRVWCPQCNYLCWCVFSGVVHRSDGMCGGRWHQGARQTRRSSCEDQLRRPAGPCFHHRGLKVQHSLSNLLLGIITAPHGVCPLSLWQEAVEKSSFFEPLRMIERGNVTEAFKSVDQVYEGKYLLCVRRTYHEHHSTSALSFLTICVCNCFPQERCEWVDRSISTWRLRACWLFLSVKRQSSMFTSPHSGQL